MHRSGYDLTAHSVDNLVRPTRFVRRRHRRVIKAPLIAQP
jgi:hypothetical protein